MVVIIVLVTIVVFIVVDLTLRHIMKRIDEAKRRKERLEALDIGLRADVSREAVSLKSVHVPDPKARILAVDDEPVILDSFRKILVLAGYSVDTVESGPEALGLIENGEYDFVFTDFKMPEFDGLEVTKAVKHIRPDIDVIMITGYATVESAVDTMKYGAMDYVEKPFTEDELVDFVNKSLIRREARIENEQPPKVHLVTASSPGLPSEHVFNVPAGVFVSPAHIWVRVEMTGEVRTGMDEFARKTIGEISAVVIPRQGQQVERGHSLFSIKQHNRTMSFPSPVSGLVTAVNEELLQNPTLLQINPYEVGWICRLQPDDLPTDLESLKIGTSVIAWYKEEIRRLEEVIKPGDQEAGSDSNDGLSDDAWKNFSSSFLQPRVP